MFRNPLRFTCECPLFRSGAEGIRTPDLRRANARSQLRGRSRAFQNRLPKLNFSAACLPMFASVCSGNCHVTVKSLPETKVHKLTIAERSDSRNFAQRGFQEVRSVRARAPSTQTLHPPKVRP